MFGVLVVAAGLNSNCIMKSGRRNCLHWPIGSAVDTVVSVSRTLFILSSVYLSRGVKSTVLTNFGHRIEQRTTIVVQPTFYS